MSNFMSRNCTELPALRPFFAPRNTIYHSQRSQGTRLPNMDFLLWYQRIRGNYNSKKSSVIAINPRLPISSIHTSGGRYPWWLKLMLLPALWIAPHLDCEHEREYYTRHTRSWVRVPPVPAHMYKYVDQIAKLPCWPPLRGQQMSHQKWIWGIHYM